MKKTVLVTGSFILVAVVGILIYMYYNSCNYDEKTGQQKKTELQDSCCKKSGPSFQTEITCPVCNFKKTETLPTEICRLVYTCSNCNKELRPKEGDCCVFCSYGTHKCPSKQ